jgi:hypothetical protein
MGQVKVRRIRRPHIIDTRPTGRLGLALLLVAVALGSWGYLALDLARDRQSASPGESRLAIAPTTDPSELERLERSRAELARDTAALEQQLHDLSENRQTQSAAVRDAQETIRQLESENARLRAQVAFLAQLFGGDDGPVEIGDLTLSDAGEQRVRYWFKIARKDAGADMLTGLARLQVRGQMNGSEQYLGLAELTAEKLEGHRLGFRQFQEIDGTLDLPADFEPQEILIVVIPDNQDTGGARRQFEWRLNEDAD